MRRTRHIWLAFALCLALVLAAMGWISATVLELDRTRRTGAHRAAVEEKVRLSLWRMDSALLPLIVGESARPYFSYSAFHPMDRAYTRMFHVVDGSRIITPSALLTFQSPHVLLHFQLGPDGQLTSPQVPTGSERDLAESGYLTHDRVVRAAANLARLAPLIDRDGLLQALPPAEAAPAVVLPDPPPADLAGEEALAQQMALNTNEQLRRTVAARRVVEQQRAQQAQAPRNVRPEGSAGKVREGAFKGVWAGGELLLARQVAIDARRHVQGCWLNWPAIRTWLRDEVGDLLPRCRLEPLHGSAAAGQTDKLATLPVRLVAGPVPADLHQPRSPLRLSLAIAWGCVLLGAAAAALLLRQAVSLSQRRGAFVSAVTHELRTPLTTFRLYADMLADGMVPDEAKRADYLSRLRDEADRLGHLVENVLAYARLAGPRPPAQLEPTTLGEIIDRAAPRLGARAAQGRMELDIQADDHARRARVRADCSRVEQVLLNLVDNACKYAGRAADRTIHLRAAVEDGLGLLCVRDHGPGICKARRKSVFTAFSKSAPDADQYAPGIGLGLALSRRLARNMGGDLTCDADVADGASFVLSLPLQPDS